MPDASTQIPGIGADTGKIYDIRMFAEYLIKTHKLSMLDGKLCYYDNNKWLNNGRKFLSQKLLYLLPRKFTRKLSAEVAHAVEVCLMSMKPSTSFNKFRVNNGIVDASNPRDIKLLSHSDSLLSTINFPVKYIEGARPRKIYRFLEQVVGDECIPLIEEIIGYMMIPTTKFEKAFVLLGNGSNGKSVFLKILQAFLGEINITSQDIYTLINNRFRGAMLRNKLANIFHELPAGKIENSATFKALVSGDIITAEEKYGVPFEFSNYAKMICSANKMPETSDTSFAFYRRWIIIPFNRTFIKKTADINLVHKLVTPDEMSGLFNVALAGLNRLLTRQHFMLPNVVQDELDKYQARGDTIKTFVSADCYLADEEITIVQDCYNHYTLFCEAMSVRPQGYRTFCKIMENEYALKKVTRLINNKSTAVWKGIRVWEPTDDDN